MEKVEMKIGFLNQCISHNMVLSKPEFTPWELSSLGEGKNAGNSLFCLSPEITLFFKKT